MESKDTISAHLEGILSDFEGGIPFEEHSPRMSRSSVRWANTDVLPAAVYCEDHTRNESPEGRNGIKCAAPVFPQADVSFTDVHPQAGMGLPTKGLQSDSRIAFMQENNNNAVPGDKIEHHSELSQVKSNSSPNAHSIELSNGQGLNRSLCKDHEEGIPDIVHSTFDSRGLRRDGEFERKEGNVETIAISPLSSPSLNHSLSSLGPGKLIDGKGGPRSVELFGYVGIDAALEQLQRKAMKEGLEFNIMIVGQSGLGKSTLMNTLFKGQVSCKSSIPLRPSEPKKTLEIQTVSHVIEERGVRMKLTVIDTPGFGDQIDNGGCWEPIIRYIGEQYERYLLEEMQVKRKRRIPDSRVHCCVYCIPSTGHTLRPLDVACLRRLSAVVNVVPVMAKADSLTLEERTAFRTRIQADLVANNIDVYPQHIFDESEEERIANNVIREKIPFAVVGSDQEHQVNGKKLLGRKTKWGIVEVENMSHCEFANFRDLLIRSHMQDLKDVTHRLLYESFRERRLSAAQAVSPSQPRLPTNGLSEPGTPVQAAS
uniref:Septin-7 n=1 Tax=Eptatretus burgeri TaxID=7764 RepID=A0A8C4QDS5_EPTBU